MGKSNLDVKNTSETEVRICNSPEEMVEAEKINQEMQVVLHKANTLMLSRISESKMFLPDRY